MCVCVYFSNFWNQFLFSYYQWKSKNGSSGSQTMMFPSEHKLCSGLTEYKLSPRGVGLRLSHAASVFQIRQSHSEATNITKQPLLWLMKITVPFYCLQNKMHKQPNDPMALASWWCPILDLLPWFFRIIQVKPKFSKKLFQPNLTFVVPLGHLLPCCRAKQTYLVTTVVHLVASTAAHLGHPGTGESDTSFDGSKVGHRLGGDIYVTPIFSTFPIIYSFITVSHTVAILLYCIYLYYLFSVL